MWPDDLPKNLIEFDQRFGNEEACRGYLFKLKWPDGFRCSKCGHHRGWPIETRFLYECASCGYQASLTSGTVMEKTRKPLVLWFKAMYLMVANKTGVSAGNLQQQLGLGSYQTAWTWLQKLRCAMGVQKKTLLTGNVEVDESYIGGREEGAYGRKLGKKSVIVGAVEDTNNGIGRIRLSTVPDASSKSLKGFVFENVEPGSIIKTDAWPAYEGLYYAGYNHAMFEIGELKRASKVLPLTHRVFSLIDRVLLGTYQGCVSAKHLQKYLDEFVFRFNRRNVKYPTRKFHRLAENAVKSKAVVYWKLVEREMPNKPLHVVAT